MADFTYIANAFANVAFTSMFPPAQGMKAIMDILGGKDPEKAKLDAARQMQMEQFDIPDQNMGEPMFERADDILDYDPDALEKAVFQAGNPNALMTPNGPALSDSEVQVIMSEYPNLSELVGMSPEEAQAVDDESNSWSDILSGINIPDFLDPSDPDFFNILNNVEENAYAASDVTARDVSQSGGVTDEDDWKDLFFDAVGSTFDAIQDLNPFQAQTVSASYTPGMTSEQMEQKDYSDSVTLDFENGNPAGQELANSLEKNPEVLEVMGTDGVNEFLSANESIIDTKEKQRIDSVVRSYVVGTDVDPEEFGKMLQHEDEQLPLDQQVSDTGATGDTGTTTTGTTTTGTTTTGTTPTGTQFDDTNPVLIQEAKEEQLWQDMRDAFWNAADKVPGSWGGTTRDILESQMDRANLLWVMKHPDNYQSELPDEGYYTQYLSDGWEGSASRLGFDFDTFINETVTKMSEGGAGHQVVSEQQPFAYYANPDMPHAYGSSLFNRMIMAIGGAKAPPRFRNSMESSALKMSDQLRRQGTMTYPEILTRIRDVYNVSPPPTPIPTPTPIPSRASIPSWTGDTGAGEPSIKELAEQDIGSGYI